MVTDPGADALLRVLDGVLVDGVPLRTDGGGLVCTACLHPAPASVASAWPELPLLTACFDFTRRRSLLSAASVSRFSREFRARLAIEGDETLSWYGWITLGAPPGSVELSTPHGIGIVPKEAWPRGAGRAELLVGLDLLAQGALIFVGNQSGLVRPEDFDAIDDLSAAKRHDDSAAVERDGGRFWFTRPRASR